jgi:hypothetical protein
VKRVVRSEELEAILAVLYATFSMTRLRLFPPTIPALLQPDTVVLAILVLMALLIWMPSN